MTKNVEWRKWDNEYIVCPHCEGDDVDERTQGIALCNTCRHIVMVETETRYRTRKASKNELDTLKELLKEMTRHGLRIDEATTEAIKKEPEND